MNKHYETYSPEGGKGTLTNNLNNHKYAKTTKGPNLLREYNEINIGTTAMGWDFTGGRGVSNVQVGIIAKKQGMGMNGQKITRRKYQG